MLINKKFWAIGILGVLVLSTVGVLAFSNKTDKNETVGMQAMHGQIPKSIQDPALKAQMDGMHNDCMKEHEKDGKRHSDSAGINHMDSMLA